jgi:hypothetical protein
MNALERRRLVRGQIIDVTVAKAGINKSRGRRIEAANSLQKQMTASQASARQPETISYPQAS